MTMTRANARVAGIYLLATLANALILVLPALSVMTGLIAAPTLSQKCAVSIVGFVLQVVIFVKAAPYLNVWETSSFCELIARGLHVVLFIPWGSFLMVALLSSIAPKELNQFPLDPLDVSLVGFAACIPSIFTQLVILLRRKK